MAINPFKKKTKEFATTGTRTIQAVEQELTNVLFELGRHNYIKHQNNKYADNQINTLTQRAAKLSEEVEKLRQLAQADMAKKIKEGTTNEATAPKA